MKSSISLIFACLLMYSTTAQLNVQQADQHYEQALKNYRSKSLEEASRAINESLRLKGTAESYYLSGLINEAMGKDLRAVSAFEAAVQLDPAYYEAIFQKGLIYLNYGDPEQAVKDFGLIIASGEIPKTRSIYFANDPTGEKSTQVLSMANLKSQIYHYRAQALGKLQRYDEALEDYEAALSLNDVADYYVSRGLLYSKMSNEQLAVNDLEAAIRKEPENQLAWYNLALLNPSIDLPEELLVDNSFGPTLGLLASKALEEGRYEDARRYYDQSIVNDGHNALTFVNRGRVHMKLQDFVAARNDFSKARLLDPTRFECLYLSGNAYFFQKEFELAVAFYNQYLTVDPNNAMIWYNGAMAYLELDNELDACHYLNKAQSLGMLQAEEMIDEHCR